MQNCEILDDLYIGAKAYIYQLPNASLREQFLDGHGVQPIGIAYASRVQSFQNTHATLYEPVRCSKPSLGIEQESGDIFYFVAYLSEKAATGCRRRLHREENEISGM